ncbi:hypothetical protein H6763_01200 [Candidatus Nomurabacteria bacterium]|uniref:Uncharacterized protein n=1 Tax=Candidatus Dojkabacteria bacterium TaxID=2099670 RepID=A0A955KX35_9BACT|nr:hypothetical protein [Candidatus Dojkabacteria bacterium]MCB9789949.1 hypothetical protein [Candidatus Nomurabacteria bacterium]MCB9803425.1 hypothetical protein [Candidatus Nomurabacteria bacterium]
MDLKKTLYKLLISATFLPVIFMFFGGMSIPSDKLYLSALIIGHAIALILHENILTFFAIDKAFLPRVVVMCLLSAGFLYLMELSLPGFSIKELNFSEVDLTVITINPIGMSKYATIGTFSALSALMYMLFLKLKD